MILNECVVKIVWAYLVKRYYNQSGIMPTLFEVAIKLIYTNLIVLRGEENSGLILWLQVQYLHDQKLFLV